MLAPEIASLYWEVVSVVRVSAYARHAACRDLRVKPDFCVCDAPEGEDARRARVLGGGGGGGGAIQNLLLT